MLQVKTFESFSRDQNLIWTEISSDQIIQRKLILLHFSESVRMMLSQLIILDFGSRILTQNRKSVSSILVLLMQIIA